jgi:protein gp37
VAERTKIEWTAQRDASGNIVAEGASWNPWYGCTKVSPGCAACYMFREMRQYGRDPEVVTRSKTKFADPLKWKEPRTIFTCSWSDWFHPAADAWRAEAWDIIRRTPQHTYQILTKRPERIIEQLPIDWHGGYPNVWLGVSVESQRYDFRAALLCTIPARVRFVSAEPLLDRLSLAHVNPYASSDDRREARQSDYFVGINVLEWPAHPPMVYTPTQRLGRIDWVIAGGESGPEARPMELDWARRLRDECTREGVAFFLKQLGGATSNKRGGAEALLDGQRWTQMPERAA